MEVLVLDNGSRDDHAKKAAQWWGANYACEPIPGLSRARNQGLRLASGDIVAFLDDDAVPAPGWLAGLCEEFQDPRVMAVTGRILPLDSPVSDQNNDLGSERQIVDHETPQWFERANFGGAGDGGNMAFRRTAIESWGGFDLRLGRGAPIAGSEEHLALFELIDLGFRVIYTPDAIVYHPVRTDSDSSRCLRELTATAGYITLLIAEYPRYRRRIVSFILEALRGTQRPWRLAKPRFLRSISRWRVVAAVTTGMLRALRVLVTRNLPRESHLAVPPAPLNSQVLIQTCDE
jgi:cellulose synthase/poly-beta-1,6-N-acetylglucosamine synthase-like glycosyltransferase